MSNVGAASRPRATVLGAWREGWSRVIAAPVMMLSLVGLGAMAALPFGLARRDEIAGSIGPWRLNVIASALLIATGAAMVWLSGGVLDRLARGRPVGAAAFFAACGAHGLRFGRLAIVLAPFYWALFAALPVYDLPAAFALLVLTMVADVARVRIVVEDRRSALAGLAAAGRFIRRRAGRVSVLWAIGALSLLGAGWMGSAVTPWQDDVSMRTLAAWELLWVVLLTFRMAGLASLVVFFQGELAHAGYTAAPLPIWPDSPAVEAIARLKADARAAQNP